jgi:aryl-alcohol dehydrogenase-like predicted oxidoreductase
MIERRPFGRTGHMSTATIFGGAALKGTQDAANRVLDVLLAYGINHIDTANSYGDSEQQIGPWMQRYRDHFFLATKTEERTYQGAKDHLHLSLARLQTDHIDLWQMHALIDPLEWAMAMGPGGALGAFVEARAQGLVRFLGVTGHGTGVARMHLQSLERFDFDSVLLPYNFAMLQNAAYAADFEALMRVCQGRNIAVQTIKAIVRGPWGEKPPNANIWYEPLQDQAAIDTAVDWVLRRPGIFLNTPAVANLLPNVLHAASRGPQATPDELADAAMRELGVTPLFR